MTDEECDASGFWVAQRFTAAITGLFPDSALAAEVTKLFPHYEIVSRQREVQSK